MLFNSYAFLLVFLPAAIAIYWFADRSARLRTWVLIVLSLAFYSYWDVRFLPLMVASILLNWLAANLYAATRRHAVIVATIVANVVLLGIFKYANFFSDNFTALFGAPIECRGRRLAALARDLRDHARGRLCRSLCFRDRVRSLFDRAFHCPAGHRRRYLDAHPGQCGPGSRHGL
jgi:hypothetical protein